MVDRRILIVLFASAAIVACKKQRAGTAGPDATSAAARDVTGEESPGVDPLAQPEQALAKNADELRSLGVRLDSDVDTDLDAAPPPPGQAPPGTAKADEMPAATRCDAVCELADTACGLRTQICDLAQDHVGESRYEAACWRATDQCTRASAACEDCRGSTAGTADVPDG